jgi:hypothetical protein
MTRIVRAWPSAYELLPQYEAVWDAEAHKAVELTCLPPPMRARRDLDAYADRFATMAAAGRRVHERMRQAWEVLDPGQAPHLVAFLGRGHATPNLATLAGGRLRVSKEDPPWRGNVGWAGDGTVPMLCAVPPELGTRQDLWRVGGERHGELAELPEAVDQVSLYEGEPLPIRGGGPEPERPWLGLDLDEIITSDMDMTIGARLLPAPLAGQRAVVTVTPRDGTPGPVFRDALSRVDDPAGGSAWRGDVPPRPSGTYEVTVEVSGVPGSGAVAASATLVVFDRRDLDHLDHDDADGSEGLDVFDGHGADGIDT